MKKENKIMFIAMVLNLVITLIKFISGILLNFSTLIADSLQSFADFMTDIISTFAAKYGDKRANKKYPFGYGLIENISNLVIGFILFALGIFIFSKVFETAEIDINPIIILILGVLIIIKFITVRYLFISGKKLKSDMLTISARESALDLVSTLIVFMVSIILLFKDFFPALVYADKVGCIIISLIIIISSIKIVYENVSSLLGKTENDESISLELKNIITKFKNIKDYNISLTKLGDYYKLDLYIKLNSSITLKDILRLEKDLKYDIKHSGLNIKFITFHEREYHKN